MTSFAATRTAMAQRGRELCVKRFDHRVMVERLEELYARLLGRTKL